MAQTFSRAYLTVPGGGGLGVGGASAAYTLIHTVPASAVYADEIWLYATNNDTVTRILTINWAGTNIIKQTLYANSGLSLVIPGLITTANASISGKHDGATDGVVVVQGFVNRITVT